MLLLLLLFVMVDTSIDGCGDDATAFQKFQLYYLLQRWWMIDTLRMCVWVRVDGCCVGNAMQSTIYSRTGMALCTCCFVNCFCKDKICLFRDRDPDGLARGVSITSR
mmetsp:Transcript_49241/g.119343  ORF Transcript_49241/g.119343 Transcript_49241/m.119343 type:complete len:107 (-) Transcript_49241:139-459(-)